MKVIGYIRVSTQGQVEDGVSLDAQEAKIRAWAAANDASEVSIFRDEGISGKRIKNRPGLTAALDAVRNGDALVCYSLTRLSRSTIDTMEIAKILERRGADLVSLSEKIDTTSAAGKMVFRLLAVLGEFERDQISERTTLALRYKKSRGEAPGGSFMPYGYKAKGNLLVPVAAEQEVIRQVHDWRTEGMSLGAIAKNLESRRIRRKAGGRRWYAIAVSRLVKRTA
jgi:DNA invertase Pin-like site-specific DNA recombinase